MDIFIFWKNGEVRKSRQQRKVLDIFHLTTGSELPYDKPGDFVRVMENDRTWHGDLVQHSLSWEVRQSGLQTPPTSL